MIPIINKDYFENYMQSPTYRYRQWIDKMDISGDQSIRSVEVTFIRHAESEENIRVQHCCAAINNLKQLKCPTYVQIVETLKLFEFNLNPRVSALGKRQLLDLKMMLNQENLWKSKVFDLCVFSPLERTKETCFAVVPEDLHDRCISLKHLEEVTPTEQLLRHYLKARINSFEKWLFEAPVQQILVVGHCQYLKNMLNLKKYMRNCDVWKATASFQVNPDSNGTVSCIWSEPVLLFRTELSIPHPIEEVLTWNNSNKSTSTEGGSDNARRVDRAVGGSENDNGDLDNNKPDEPCCRICQMSQSEEPLKKLIKPCKCAGSVSFVHLDCLNTWRATSTTAYFTCSVCKYNYQFERTLVAQVVTREEFVAGVASLMILALIALSGALVTLAVEYMRVPFTVATFIYRVTEVTPYWRACGRLQMLPFTAVLRDIYSHSSGVNHMIKEFIRFAQSPLPMMYFLCQTSVAASIDALVTGAAVVGSVGFLMHFYSRIRLLRNFGEIYWLQYIVMTAAWFSSLGNKALGRVWLVVGCAIAAREIYLVLVVHARKLSNWLGDKIMEVNS